MDSAVLNLSGQDGPDNEKEGFVESEEELLSESDAIVPSVWSLSFYQRFFDVDTSDVLYRILWSMVPSRSSFLECQLRSKRHRRPDLYGPFWVCLTLIFSTAIASNISNYLQQQHQRLEWHYDFHKVSITATAIFGYAWIVPTLLYAYLWTKQKSVSFIELICLYGYSMAVYVPVSVLWIIQVNFLQWIVTLLGAGLSGTVLSFSLWPLLQSQNDKKTSFFLLSLVLISHFLLATGFMMAFFHVSDNNQVPDKHFKSGSYSNATSNITLRI